MILYFIKKSIVTICLNLSILLIGYFSYEQIANEFIPAIKVPAVGVVFPTTVMSHERVVQDLIGPVEKSLLSTGDVEKIETTLDQDRAMLFIFYKWSIPPEECLLKARQVVSSVARPAEVLEPIFVLHRPTMSPIFRVAFSGAPIAQLTSQIGELAADIERLPGVSGVALNGGTPQKGLIDVDAVQAARLGYNATDVLSSAAGTWSFRYLYRDERSPASTYIRYPLQSLQGLALSQVQSANAAEKSVPLKWIAKVGETHSPASVLFGSGEEALILEVTKSPGSDALSIVERVQQKIAKLNDESEKLRSVVIYNEAEKIKQAQAGVFQNFAIGVTLNSLILIVFLGSIIGALVASCVFPTAILGTLYIMNASGISLNIFALNGFSLASGMITDASIVVLESIMRRFQMGEELVSACNRGTKDVMVGVFASTLTTAAVIVPISTQSGVSSKLFSDLGITLVATQFVCLIAVFTFVPWLCSKILSDSEYRPAPIHYLFLASSFLVHNMTKLGHVALQKSLTSKTIRWVMPSVLTAISVVMLFFMPKSEFLPTVAANTYSVSMPVKRIRLMNEGPELRRQLAEVVGNFEGVKWVVTFSDSDSLKVILNIENTQNIPMLTRKISESLQIPISKVIALPLGPTPPSEPMSYDGYYFIRHDIAEEKKSKLLQEFCARPGIRDCHFEDHFEEPSWLLKPKPLEVVRSHTNIIETTFNVASYTKNLNLAGLANLPFSMPVELKLSNIPSVVDYPLLVGESRQAISRLQSGFLNVFSQGSNAKFRRDSIDYTPFYFRVADLTIGEAVTAMWELQDKMKIPRPLVLPMGTLETMNDTFDKMIEALILSGILILLVLVIQFQSLTQALIVMYAMPLAVGGAVIGLHIMGETLNVGVIVGFILLIGIIVNNGILLMDAINQRTTTGMALLEAIKEAVESRTRPILMTTFSTVFGMLPTLVLEAEGKELYQGMAIVNVFGMIFGTFLTLVVIPIVIRLVLQRTNDKSTSAQTEVAV
jgi:HAE1 family hydrophobic/amphiphilic exporter-1